MDEQKYRVIFKGEIAPHTDGEEVKKNLAALFKVGVKEVEQLFSGKRFVLKENAGLEEAQEYKGQLEKTGAICTIVKIEETGPIPKPPGPTPPVSKIEEAGTIPKPPEPTPPVSKIEEAGTAPKSPESTPPIGEKLRPAPDRTAGEPESRYRLMFSGEILADKDINEVKTQLSIFYKVEPDRIEAFFTGKPVVIVDSTDFWTAVSYLNRFKECGAVGYLETVDPGKPIEDTPGKYKIVFGGELQEGQELLAVKTRLAAVFKVPGVVVDKLFLEKPLLIRTGLSPEAAQSYKTNFEKTGARCQVLEIPGIPPPPPPPAPKVPSISSPPPRTVPTPRRPVVSPLPPQPREKNVALPLFTLIAIIAVAVIIFKVITSKSREPEPTNSKPVAAAPRKSAQPEKPPPTSPQPQEKPQRSSSLLPEQTKPFEDPNKYYSVSLPDGYLTINESQGNQSKILFNYSLNVNITIIVYPLRENWDPQEAMFKKVEDIGGGNAGALSRLRVENYGQVSFKELEGYEVILKEGNQLAHVYELVSPKKTLFSIIIAAVGDNNQENHDLLDKAIRESLEFH